MTRLWVRGARLVDPSQGLDAEGDLLIEDGRIAAAGSGVVRAEDRDAFPRPRIFS